MHRNPLFVPALLTLLLVVSFRFGEGGIQWLWSDLLAMPVALAVSSAVLWLLMLRNADHCHR